MVELADQATVALEPIPLHHTRGRLTGTVYLDRAKDGVLGPEDTPIPATTLTITGRGMTQDVQSEPDGRYALHTVPGDYTISVQLPPGAQLTSGSNPMRVTLPELGEVETNIGIFQEPMSISGFVFVDSNGNGLRDLGEAGLPGIQVDTSIVNAPIEVPSVATGPDGSYFFAVPTAGEYFIFAWTNLAPYLPQYGPRTAAVSSGVNATIDIPVRTTPATIRGRITAGTGSPAGGVRVALGGKAADGTPYVPVTGTDGRPVGDAVTNANGEYGFTNLDPRLTYTITPRSEVAVSPTQQTITGAGTADFTLASSAPPPLLGSDGASGIYSDGQLVLQVGGGISGSLHNSVVTQVTSTTQVTLDISSVQVAKSILQAATHCKVYFDTNSDHAYTEGEGLAGVPVWVTNNGVLQGWSLSLPNGDCNLQVDPVDGATTVHVAPIGEDSSTAHYALDYVTSGNHEFRFSGSWRGAIRVGTVFVDENRNGIHDAADTLSTSAAINYGPIGNLACPSGTAFPDAHGVIRIQASELCGSNGYLRLVVPAGYRALDPVELRQDHAVEGFTFGLQRIFPGQVTGTLWHETSGNSLPDASEARLGGVTVTITGQGRNTSVQTDAQGRYAFDDLPAGGYEVTVPSMIGLAEGGRYAINVPVGAVTVGNGAVVSDFAYRYTDLPATIEGLVFADLNMNGVHEPSELGLPDRQITIAGPAGTISLRTGPDGRYRFTGPAGGYHLSIRPNPDHPFGTVPALQGGDLVWSFDGVAAGSTRQADFGMAPARYAGSGAVTVEGHVQVNASGYTTWDLPGQRLDLTVEACNSQKVAYTTTILTDSQGRFSEPIPADCPYTLILQAIPPYNSELITASTNNLGITPVTSMDAAGLMVVRGQNVTPAGQNASRVNAEFTLRTSPDTPATLTGAVTLRTGPIETRPIANFPVTILAPSGDPVVVRTDGTGIFRAPAQLGVDYRIEVDATGYGPTPTTSATLRAHPGENWAVFALGGGLTPVTGQLAGAEADIARPVPGYPVTIALPGEGLLIVSSSPDGTFRQDGLPDTAQPYEIRVPVIAPWQAAMAGSSIGTGSVRTSETTPDGGYDVMLLRDLARLTIRGRVLEGAGTTPVEGFPVKISGGGQTQTVLSQVDGSYSYVIPTMGDYSVIASPTQTFMTSDGATQVVGTMRWPLPPGSGEPPAFDIRVDRALVPLLCVTVQDATGQPEPPVGPLQGQGVAGVPVTFTPLFAGSAITVDSNVGGDACLEQVRAGTWRASIEVTPPWTGTLGPDTVLIQAGTATSAPGIINLVNQTVTIGGMVFDDQNRNGIKEASEVAMAGVPVVALDPTGSPSTDINGVPLPATMSAGDGTFTISGLRALPPMEFYAVGIDPNDPAHAPSLHPVTVEADLSYSGAAAQGVMLGAVGVISWQGRIWEDRNRDGIVEASEAQLAGIEVALTTDGATPVVGLDGQALPSAVTDHYGRYSFPRLPAAPMFTGYTPMIVGLAGYSLSPLPAGGEPWVPGAVVNQDVVADPVVTLRGQVLDEALGIGVPGVRVDVIQLAGTRDPLLRTAFWTDESGRFEEPMPHGQYLLFLNYPDGYGPGSTAGSQTQGVVSTTLDVPGGVLDVQFSIVKPIVQRFTDVPIDHGFYADIEWLATQGITTGYADGRYGVNDKVLREQMAAFFYRAAGSPPVDTANCHTFADVEAGSFFNTPICWLKQQGITTGYSPTTYGYGDPVLREQMAAFLYRAAGSPAVDTTGCHTFADVDPASGFNTAICWLKQQGITTGYSPTTYGYGEPVLRGEMAAFLHRWLT